MDFKNVDLNDYCFTLDLHKSMFFIDMLKNAYEFTLKGDEIEIFKKLNNGISEPITRKELIYSIQVEMAEKYDYSSLRKMSSNEIKHLPNKEKCILTFYHQFQTVDSIYKTIDNMVYLEKETIKWSQEILDKSPMAIRVLKAAMNADCDGQSGLQQLAGDATLMFYMTEEAQEGRDAFKEKRKPNFKKFPRLP